MDPVLDVVRMLFEGTLERIRRGPSRRWLYPLAVTLVVLLGFTLSLIHDGLVKFGA